jgi:hypothetical protein
MVSNLMKGLCIDSKLFNTTKTTTGMNGEGKIRAVYAFKATPL